MWSYEQTVSNELLNGRYLVLELAALLDRLEEAAARDKKPAAGDARLSTLRDAVALIASRADQPNRAERILRLYTAPE